MSNFLVTENAVLLDAKSAVEIAIKKQFTKNAVAEVKIDIEKDFEDDLVMVIRITITDAFGSEDKKKMVGLVRHIKSELSSFSKNEYNSYFPMVSFISEKDAIERKREFA